MNAELKTYLATIGAIGGKNGRGASKRRSPEHYKRMAELRRAKRLQAKPA